MFFKPKKQNKKTVTNREVFSEIWQLLRFMRRMRVQNTFLVLSIVLAFLAVLFNAAEMGLLIPLIRGIIQQDFHFLSNVPFFGNIVDFFPGIFNSFYALFMLLVVTIFTVAIINNVLSYASTICIHRQIRLATANIRNLIFDRYLEFGKLYFDRTGVGTLNTILMNYSNTIPMELRAVQKLLSEIFSLAAYTIILLFISWKLTLITLLIFPAMNYFTLSIIRAIKKITKALVGARKNLDQKIFNILTCIPLVKAYVREEDEKRFFRKVNEREVRMQMQIALKQQLIGPIQSVSALVALLMLAALINVVAPPAGPGSASAYLVFFFLVRRMVPSFNAVNKFALSLAKASGGMDVISDVLENNDDKFIIRGGHLKFEGLRSGVEFRHLNFSYLPTVPVLKDVSFTIQKGQTVAIVGPTGSGKTTIISLIMRFYDCPPGSIWVDGAPIQDYTLESLRKQMALVTQDIQLFNDTIRANMSYGLNAYGSDDLLMKVAKQARLDTMIESLPDKLDTPIGDRGIKLSGGEKQRLSIARALLKNAGIMILDEATSSLDSTTEKLIQEAIDEAVQDRTAIIIAHRLSTIRHADKIIVLDHGRIVEEGALDELLTKKAVFHDFWKAQQFV